MSNDSARRREIRRLFASREKQGLTFVPLPTIERWCFSGANGVVRRTPSKSVRDSDSDSDRDSDPDYGE